MLGRQLTVVAIALQLSVPVVALADGGGPGPVEVNGDYHSGVVTTTVDDLPQPGASTKSSTIVAAVAAPCTWLQVGQLMQLSLPTTVNGVAGTWWQQYCGGSGWKGSADFVPNSSTPAAALRVSPGRLAERAANRLSLPIPTSDLNPSPHALVNLAEWFWVRRSSWSTLRQRTQAGPVWAQVVARPTSTTWDPGDGSLPFTCAGAGTPYVKSEPAEAQSTTCSYTYRRSSADEPQSGPDPNDRFFTVTVTTTWSVTWTGAGGLSGTLPAMTRSSSFPLAVAERDAVVTGGSG